MHLPGARGVEDARARIGRGAGREDVVHQDHDRVTQDHARTEPERAAHVGSPRLGAEGRVLDGGPRSHEQPGAARETTASREAARQEERLVVAACAKPGEVQRDRHDESGVREGVVRGQQLGERLGEASVTVILEALNRAREDVARITGSIRPEGSGARECWGVTHRHARGHDRRPARGTERGGCARGQHLVAGDARAGEENIEPEGDPSSHGIPFPGGRPTVLDFAGRRKRTGAGFTTPCAPSTLARVVLTEARLAQDLTAAMKARDAQRVSVLRSVVAAAKHVKVERRVPELEEADLVQVMRREVRKREEAEEYAVKAGRDDLVTQNRAERAILESYVPAALGGAELERAIRDVLATGGERQIGAVMTALRQRYPGRVDGKAASDLARKILAEPAAS